MSLVNAPFINALTVDVEDYYQVSAFEHVIPRSRWDHWESRVEHNTRRLLSLLDDCQVKGTFFILGWVADKFPSLVEEIAAQGHEVGSHSYWHRLIYELSPEEFRADVRRSKQSLEQILSRPVSLYRAPSFSITARSLWALDILREEGFTVDSSVFPVRHDRYGLRTAPCEPHVHDLRSGSLVEFPASTVNAAGCRWPVGGGGYFRLYPLAVTRRAIANANNAGRPFMFYIHPWEIDPQQPRVPGVGWRSRARHYVNLSRTEAKLRALLATAPFGRVTQSLESLGFNLTHQASIPTAPIRSTAGRASAGPALAGLKR